MLEATTVPISAIQATIKYGVRKINVDTDIAWLHGSGTRLAEEPQKFDLRDYMSATRGDDQDCQPEDEFGCAGHAFRLQADHDRRHEG